MKGETAMIKIAHHLVDNSLFLPYSLSDVQKTILQALLREKQLYTYTHPNELVFELLLREKIIDAAKLLAKSRARFTTFKHSRCNERFWNRNELGGFELKRDILPSQGINDIFNNGHLYGFECATAIVIVFYKAVLDVIPEEIFNQLFAGLVLYDWHYDKDLALTTKVGDDYIPGDCLYFKNPDHSPETPQWQGENVIFLENGLYYGHGVGIKTEDEMIETLNKQRKENATKSAYLLNQTTRVGFKYLSTFAQNEPKIRISLNPSEVVLGKIGLSTFLYL